MLDAQAASWPGQLSRPNEDAYACSADFLVVADGATAPAGLGIGCIHGPRWYAQRLAAVANLANAEDPTASLKAVLAEAIQRTTAAHSDTCDTDHPGTPSATVVMVRPGDAEVDWLVLGDATLALESPSGLEVITDDRLFNSSKDERAAALYGGNADGKRGARVAMLSNVQRKFRNTAGGFWIAAANPKASEEALVGSEQVAPGSEWRAGLFSDGAAIAVEEYALFDWKGALDHLAASGPSSFLEAIRKVEADDVDMVTYPRMKVSDDATVAYVSAVSRGLTHG